MPSCSRSLQVLYKTKRYCCIVRKKHLPPVPYVKLEITNGDELLKSCLDERRRELCFEDHRWFDLRRLGMPAIQHTFSITNGQIQTYRLEKGSSKYVLPIAREVKDRNPELEK